MSDLLIEQFCQMLAEHLEETSSVSKPESITFLQSVIQADARLRTVFEDRMVQFNQGNAVGFQTWLESGARGFFGTNYVVHDPTVLQEGMKTLLDELARRPVGTPSNLPLSGVVKFVGREESLAQVHEKLQSASTVAVTSVSGMGGIGKTELALQYAYQHLQMNTYLGGLCWINVRAQDVGLGLLEFARTRLGLPEPPDNLETLLEKVQWVCQRWQGEPILVVLDDVTAYEAVNPYLNLLDPRFRVLITTRLKLNDTKELELGVLTESASLELLRVLVRNPSRIDSQLADAQRLCEWLGYLPLGLELVGRYLARREDLSLVEMLERLEAKKLAAQALVQTNQMTAQLGVAAAFQLTWDDDQFPDEAKMLCGLLSVFALAPIRWNLVEKCVPDWDQEDLETCQVDHLLGRSLLSRVGKGLYQLHQLLREFFAAKREQMANDVALKQTVCQVMTAEATRMPIVETQAQVEQFTHLIPHLKEVATTLCMWIADADLIYPSTRVAQFYGAQADYTSALTWYQHCLETAEARLSNNHPDVAAILDNLASFYRIVGRYTEAKPLFQRAIAIREQQLGADHPDVAKSLNNFALLYHAQGQYSKAEVYYQQALSIHEQQLGSDHWEFATSLNNLAEVYRAQGRYADAEPLLQRSLSIRLQRLGKNHPDVAMSLSNLALLYHAQGQYAKAEVHHQQALSIYEHQLGNDHPDVANSLNNLASLYQAQGKYAEAESSYQRSLEIWEQKLGKDHPSVANSLSNLALLYQAQGKYAKAESLLQKSLIIREQKFGSDNSDVANSLNNLASLYQAQGKYAEAEPFYQRSLEIWEQQLGKDHPNVAKNLNNLAFLYQTQGRYIEAEPLYQRSLAIYEQQLGSDHPDVAQIFNNLAALYVMQGRYSEARPLLQRSLNLREQQLGSDHPDVAQTLINLAYLQQIQGFYSQAEPLYQRALSIQKQQLGANHPDVANSLNHLAEAYRAQGCYDEAEPLYEQSLAIYEQQLGKDHPYVANSLNGLGVLYQAQGRYAEAEPLYQRSISIREQQLGENHPDVAQSFNNLALLYQTQGRSAEAEPLYRRSLAIWEQQLGKNHPYVGRSLIGLAYLCYVQGRYTEAEPLYQRSLAILEPQLGEEHPDVANILNNLALLYQTQGRYTEAEPLYIRAMSIWGRHLGANHPNTQTCKQNFLNLLNQAFASGKTSQLSDHLLTQSALQQIRIANQGHLIHKFRAKDSTGRLAYYFVLIHPSAEQKFLQALNSTESIDLAEYGEIIASCYGETPDDKTKAFLKERYGFDV